MHARTPFLLVGALAWVALVAGCPPESTPDPDPNPAQRLFDAQFIYPAGDQPFAVVVADLNADGLPDVITPN